VHATADQFWHHVDHAPQGDQLHQLAGVVTTVTAARGAETAVRMATTGPDGPTGGFFHDDGPSNGDQCLGDQAFSRMNVRPASQRHSAARPTATAIPSIMMLPL
jgi:hypothetical protein